MPHSLRSSWTLKDVLAWEALQSARYELVDGVGRMMVSALMARLTTEYWILIVIEDVYFLGGNG